jgi:tetratricopeptide (TPR) repeat protein
VSSARPTRVLLVGWGTAEWALLSPLLDSGQLPNLGRLIRQGALGRPVTPHPSLPLPIWTSVATGVHPDRHGLLSPAPLHTRRQPAVWDTLAAHGLRCHVIGWPGAVQAEEIPGLFVTPDFGAKPDPQSFSPTHFAEALAELHLPAGAFPPAALQELLPLAHLIDQRYDDRLGRIAHALAMACSLHNAATYALAEQPWDFAAVHYDALAYCSVHFSEFLPPRMAHVDPAAHEIYGDLLPAVYRFHDMLLGALLDLAGPDAAVLLVAPFGYAAADDRPHKNTTSFTDHQAWITRSGLLCLRAPALPADELIYGARLVDVAPTVLQLLGLPAENLDGRSLTAAANPAPLSPDSQGLATQFLAMVASDPASPANEQEQFQLAGVYMSTGRPQLALPLLESLAAEAPEEIRYQRTLAQCCIVLGLVEQAETLLDALIEGQEPHAWAHFLRGVIYSHRRQFDLALADLEKAASLGENSASLHAFLGNIYLSKRLAAHAETAYATALRLDPASPDALGGMAALHNLRREPERAAELALEAIALRYETPAAHLQLGVALARLGQWHRAAVALRTTLTLAPGVSSAARYLDVVNARLLPHQRA